jgi:hypothetical protein
MCVEILFFFIFVVLKKILFKKITNIYIYYMDLCCVICGCSWTNFYIEDYKSYIDRYKKNKNIDKYTDKYIDEQTFNNLRKNMKFMDEILILGKNNKIIKNHNWTDRNHFTDLDDPSKIVKQEYEVSTDYYEKYPDDEKYWVDAKIVHTDCWKYIKHKYNKELKYSDLDKNIVKYKSDFKDREYMIFPPLNIDYGDIKKYWSNDYGFLIDNIIIDKQFYLLQSPLSVLKEISRMKKSIISIKRTSKKDSKKGSKKGSKRGSKKGSKKQSKKSLRKMKRVEDDYNKIIDRIDKIYKQII